MSVFDSPSTAQQLSHTAVVTSSGAVVTPITVEIYKTGLVKTIFLKMTNISSTSNDQLRLAAGTVPPTFLPKNSINICPITTRNNATFSVGCLSIDGTGAILIGIDQGLGAFSSGVTIGLGINSDGVTATYV